MRILTTFLCLISLGLTILEAQSPFESLTYRNVGPNRGGRVTSVEGIHDIPGTFYMGSTGGGLWKTTDYGVTWNNVSDGYFSTPSIGAIAVYQANPTTVYAGTGSDGIRSNVITGKGVYRSSDGGKSWEHAGLKNSGQIGAVEIHPENENVVFVAAIGQAFQPNEERGVYRTRDGGNSWEKVYYHSDTVGVVDLEFAPDNPDLIYAALWRVERKPWTIISGGENSGGLIRSTNGGDSWEKVGKGLPEGLIGKMDLAVSAQDPEVVYALVEAPSGKGGLYRSSDRGLNFELVSNKKGLVIRPFYFLNVEANPQNANSVYVNTLRYHKSEDGGKTWKTLSTPHGDNHDVWINKHDTLIMVQANDGGANVTTNGGKTWSSQNNQPTSELYQVEVDHQYPYWLYAGQQDNTTISVPSLPPVNAPGGPDSFWMDVGGCETGPAVPRPDNPNIVYSNCKGRFGVYNKQTGQEMQYYVGASNMYGHNPKDLKFRFQRVSPIHISPHNPDVVYHTSQFVHKTTNGGQTWEIISPDLTAFDPEKQVISGAPITRDVTGEEFYSTIYSIRESTLEAGIIWVGANDGPIHVTRDGGANWSNVTPEGLPEGGRVDAVEPSPHQASKAYVAVLRYQLGDWKPYIYKTADYGESWTLLTSGNGIPEDYPVRVVREDPAREGLLYAGTEFGMFISFDDGANWSPFQQNLPVTPITDIKIHRNDLILSTMGRGFWIMDNLSVLHQDPPKEDHWLVSPKTAVRYRYRGNSSSSVPYYPGPAVSVDYSLSTKPESLRLEIYNSVGAMIRSFEARPDDSEGKGTSDQAMRGPFWMRPKPMLDREAGSHRFRWDMKHEGPWNKNPKMSGQNGPLVPPGIYTFKLVVDDKSYESTTELILDPRIDQDGMKQVIGEQYRMSLQVQSLYNDAQKLAQKVSEDIKTWEESSKKKKEAKLTALNDVKAQLVTSEGTYMTPMLIDQIRYLGSMLVRADQVPGDDSRKRLKELKSEFDKLQEAYKSI